MIRIGQLVASGRTSEVFAYGGDSVVKVPRPHVPAHWARLEARFTAAVRRIGAPTPEVRDVVQVDGRDSIVFERIVGQSMWDRLLARPDELGSLVGELVSVQRRIHRLGLPEELPDLVGRMRSKIGNARLLTDDDRRQACALLDGLPRGAAVLHGDLHPGNVLLSRTGPIVIDWFDVAIGHPMADVVRSSILIRPANGRAEFVHLAGATGDLLTTLYHAYRRQFSDLLEGDGDTQATWLAVVAASRLSEGAEADTSGLLELLRERTSPNSPGLAGDDGP